MAGAVELASGSTYRQDTKFDRFRTMSVPGSFLQRLEDRSWVRGSGATGRSMGKSKIRSARAFGLSLALVVAAASGGCRPGEPEAGQDTSSSANGSGEDVVVNMSGMNMIQPPDRIEGLKRNALSGDNRAANDLANHYSRTGPREEELRWLTLAGNRGDCAALALLRDHAWRSGDQQARRRWNDLLRRNVCTWGKTYTASQGPESDSMPLWDDE